MRRVLIAVVGFALVVASCGSGDDDTADPDDSVTTSSTAAPSSTAAGGSEESPTPTTTGAAPEVELTATARGVTAETITIGVSQVNVDELRSAGLVQTNHGDYELIYRALIDDLNRRGGVNGRTVDMRFELYFPVGSTEAEELCTKFTEDEEVFLVVGGLVGDTILCVTELHETISIGGTSISNDVIERSGGRLVTPNAASGRGVDLSVAAFHDAGVLDGEVIGIFAPSGNEGEAEQFETLLSDLGYEVAVVTVATAAGADAEAARREFEVFTEVYETNGVTALVIAGTPLIPLEGVEAAGLDVDLFVDLANQGGVNAVGRGNPEAATGVISVAGLIEGPDQMADPLLAECIDVFEEANPDIEVPVMRSVEPGEPDWAIGIRLACQRLRVFEMAAIAAGPELTNETFLAAVDAMGDFSLPAMPFASFGPDKRDASDTVVLAEWSPDAGPSGGFVAIGEVTDATP